MIDKSNLYFKQAELLLDVLPLIAKHDCFALKGGTAINLFVQNMPRLSVDIDLTYLPVKERGDSLEHIQRTLKNIAYDIEKYIIDSAVEEIEIPNPVMVNKLRVSRRGSEIKIEPNLVIRGAVFSCEERDLSFRAQELFGIEFRMRLVSLADLYGGKICAALDRQHPRDLFDIKLLLDQDGVTDDIRTGFLVYLISHDRPMHEVLSPQMKDFKDVYLREFQGMTDKEVSYDELVDARFRLVDIIKRGLSGTEKAFLIAFKKGEPDWDLLGISGVENLPAVRWKLHNIKKMGEQKHLDFIRKLEKSLS